MSKPSQENIVFEPLSDIEAGDAFIDGLAEIYNAVIAVSKPLITEVGIGDRDEKS